MLFVCPLIGVALTMDANVNRRTTYPIQVHLGRTGSNIGTAGTFQFQSVSNLEGDIVMYGSVSTVSLIVDGTLIVQGSITADNQVQSISVTFFFFFSLINN